MFQEDDKKIFEYFNGTETVCEDPLDIHLKLMSDTSFDWEVVWMQWSSSMEALGGFEDEDKEKEIDEKALAKFAPELASSMGKLIVKGRELFNLPKLHRDDSGEVVGVSSTQVMVVLKDYLMFMSDVKKNTDESQTSVGSTEQVGAVVSPTKNGADYISTSDESNSARAYL